MRKREEPRIKRRACKTPLSGMLGCAYGTIQTMLTGKVFNKLLNIILQPAFQALREAEGDMLEGSVNWGLSNWRVIFQVSWMS